METIKTNFIDKRKTNRVGHYFCENCLNFIDKKWKIAKHDGIITRIVCICPKCLSEKIKMVE